MDTEEHEYESLQPPRKRFRHESYTTSLKSVHLPSATRSTYLDASLEDNQSHFYEALQAQRQLNLSPGFVRFANGVDGLSQTLPLLVVNADIIVEKWLDAVEGCKGEEESLKAFLDLMAKLCFDLRTTLHAHFSRIYTTLLALAHPQHHYSSTVLTLLFSTLSSLLRYTCPPTADPSDVYTEFLRAVRLCGDELQRAAGEVWASAVLRRLKGDERASGVRLLVEKLEEEGQGEGVFEAWAVVSACKGVNQTLHSSCVSIVQSLLNQYLHSSPQDEKVYILLRRVLRALIHHIPNSDVDVFEPLASLVISKWKEGEDKEGRMTKILCEICQVRRGSRVSHAQMETLLQHLSSLPLTPPLAHFALAILTSSTYTTPSSTVLGYFNHHFDLSSTNHTGDVLNLTRSLAEMEYPHFKSLVRPRFVKNIGAYVRGGGEVRGEVLELVGCLQERGLMDGVKELDLGDVVGEDKVIDLASLLPVLPFLPQADSSAFLKRELSALLDPQEWKEDDAWILGTILRAHKPTEDIVVDVVEKVLQKWGGDEWVMGGVWEYVKSNASPRLCAESLQVLRANIQHHSHILRLSSLHLLSTSRSEIIDKLIEAESIPLAISGVRERVLKIQRLGMYVKSVEDAGVVTSWLLAQLKVNLKPLWSASIHALASLHERYKNVVGEAVLDQLGKAERGELESESEQMHQEEAKEESGEEGWQESEHTWRDPSAVKLEKCVREVWNETYQERLRRNISKDLTIPSNQRLDVLNYNIQLLHLLAECPSLLQHTERVMKLFMDFSAEGVGVKRVKLVAWLGALSKMRRPKKGSASVVTDETSKAYERALEFLSFPDVAIQSPALECVLNFLENFPASSSSAITSHQATRLRNLLNDKLWKEELVKFRNAAGDDDGVVSLEKENGENGFSLLLVRILYGIMRDRRRAATTARAAETRRSCLRLLADISGERELQLFVTLMLHPFSYTQTSDGDGSGPGDLPADVTERQQMGYLTLLEDVLKTLGRALGERLWKVLFDTTMRICANAQQRLDDLAAIGEAPAETAEGEVEGAADEDKEEGEEEEGGASPASLKILRNIRQHGIKRLVTFSRLPTIPDLTPCLQVLFSAAISPRLTNSFPVENSQSPSGLLELFAVWASEAQYVNYLLQEASLLPRVYECLSATGVKPAVISKIFDIVESLLNRASEVEGVAGTHIIPHTEHLLDSFALLLKNNTLSDASDSDLVGKRMISLLSQLAPYAREGRAASTLIRLFIPLLRKPSKMVPEKTKADMLDTCSALLPFVDALTETPLFEDVFKAFSSLFQALKSRQARLSLVKAFATICTFQTQTEQLQDVGSLLADLNSFKERRVDEADFERRLKAFALLNEQVFKELDVKHWPPILHNMLHAIQDREELSLRINASTSLKRFVDRLADDSNGSPALLTSLNKIFMPGLRNGLHTRSEAVRVELLGVLHYATRRCSNIKAFQELQILLAEGDEEADFFNNVYHIQLHRRTRALRRLAEMCDTGAIRNGTLAEIFVPLVGNFVQHSKVVDHTLATEAINTLGRITHQLTWSSYNAVVQQYLKQVRAGGDNERVNVRALVAILDNFHFAMDSTAVEEVGGDQELEGVEPTPAQAASTQRIQDAVVQRLLPTLMDHLNKRGEVDDNLRIPISTGIVTIALHLPKDSKDAQISRLLTVLSQALRSRSQETRDLVRDTLCRIITNVGNDYLATLVTELRGALLRGPHLHILATVVHAILVHVTKAEHAERFTSFDASAADIAHVSAEVIFGQSGRDTVSEGFKTTMREVRGSAARGLDSFMILARVISPQALNQILLPIRSIMHETASHKVLQSVDDVVKKISVGLNSNPKLESLDLLTLSHTLIQGNAKFLQVTPRVSRSAKGRRKDVDEDVKVQLQRKVASDSDHYATNSYRFVALGLDLLGTAFRRSRFDLQDGQTLSRLEPLVNILGKCLYSANGNVVVLTLRAISVIIKFPLKALDVALPVFVRQIFVIMRTAGNTESDVVQAAMRSLAVIIRDCPASLVKEADLTFLLELISPDAEEPNRQSSVFALFRAIVARRFVVPEIYDLMERISEVMVTSQSPQTQELCRGVLLQFLLEYPQGKGRLRTQMTFLAKNLSYSFESGRMSVMELLGAVFTKFNDDLIREYSDLFFVALVMSLANEDSVKCREMVVELLRSLLSKQSASQITSLVSHVQIWTAQHSQPALLRVGFQTYGIVFEVLKSNGATLSPVFLQNLTAVLEAAVQSQHDLEMASEAQPEAETTLEWHSSYQGLCVLEKLIKLVKPIPWDSVPRNQVMKLLLFPHLWVRKACCRLLGLFFAESQTSPDLSLIYDTSELIEIANKLSLQLKATNIDNPMALQVVKNLLYVSKHLLPLDGQDQAAAAAKHDEIGDADDNDEGEDDDDGEGEEVKQQRLENPMPWLFSKLSYQARSAYIARSNRSQAAGAWDVSISSVLRWFAAMANHMSASHVEKYLVHILSPVYRIIDDDSIHDPKMGDIKTLAQELLDLVQAKVGTTKFSAVYSQIKAGITETRRERRNARMMQVVVNPEAALKRRAHRNDLKKDSRKRRDRSFADSKIRNNPLKRRRVSAA